MEAVVSPSEFAKELAGATGQADDKAKTTVVPVLGKAGAPVAGVPAELTKAVAAESGAGTKRQRDAPSTAGPPAELTKAAPAATTGLPAELTKAAPAATTGLPVEPAKAAPTAAATNQAKM